MQKEEIIVIAQLLTALKEMTLKLEHAIKKKDGEEFARAKKEILALQTQIDQLL